MDNQNHLELVRYILDQNTENLTLEFVKQAKRDFSKKNKLSDIISNIKILREYNKFVKAGLVQKNSLFESVLKKRAIRSQSGIVPVQVLTKPFACPGQCIFCPNDPEMPKSYIKSEPWAMRARLNQFDPYKQVRNRLLSLTLAWHATDKIEMIVLGGTWDVYPEDYKIEFVKSLYDACNTFPEFFEKVTLADELGDSLEWKKNTTKEQKKFGYHVEKVEEISKQPDRKIAIKTNETAKHKIIGLTIETRPEFVTDIHCRQWRNLGVTRIEMGVQSMFDEVLSANKRGHGVLEIQQACHKLRQYGFKFSIHLMPGLYKSTIQKDIETFAKVFADPSVKPDELKFYPTSVIPNTQLYNLYQSWEYIPLQTSEIKQIIETVLLEKIPPYTRIKRLIRDIPSTEIVAGSTVTNLSQLTRADVEKKLAHDPELRKKLYTRLYQNSIFCENKEWFVDMDVTNTLPQNDEIQTFTIGFSPDTTQQRNFVSLDTRSREIRNRYFTPHAPKPQNIGIMIRKYLSSAGKEYFISIEDELGYLYGFVRLLLPYDGELAETEGLGQNVAVVRELHIYGDLAQIDITSKNTIQHKGLGKQLMDIAETIATKHKYKKLSVIAGVGVRKYYEKIDYHLVGTYMLKSLT